MSVLKLLDSLISVQEFNELFANWFVYICALKCIVITLWIRAIAPSVWEVLISSFNDYLNYNSKSIYRSCDIQQVTCPNLASSIDAVGLEALRATQTDLALELLTHFVFCLSELKKVSLSG